MFKNNEGKSFTDFTEDVYKAEQRGWWYDIEKGDFDNDGDMDLIVGNLGLNYKYQASVDKPFRVYLNDFDENAKKDFLKGAEIAYETIITDFGDSDNKLTTSKPLLSNKIYDRFNNALKERGKRGHLAEITFIGINSAEIKEHKKIGNILNVTVDFIAEVITCIRDKEKKIVSGDPEKIKKIYDTWVYSRDTTSVNPNWQLVNTLT